MKIDIFNTDKKYDIIYADPPWSYKVYSKDIGHKRTASSHYKTMTTDELENLPINKISNDNSVLLMWVTYPFLEYGLRLIKHFGFKYKTCAFSWIKLNKKSKTDFVGMGFYTRANNEICLLATKGKGLERKSKSIRQIVMSPIEEHSKKPDEVRSRIVELFGDLPKIELFARQKIDGWDYFGDEI